METITIGKEGMSLVKMAAVARNGAGVRLSKGSENRIAASRRLIEKWVAEERPVYGVTTGFGALSDITISRKDTRKLQKNILMSHSAGVGRPLEPEIVRGVLALRIQDLARGNSGIRLETVKRLAELLNKNVCPVIPEQGSVGASGDLAPLAHLSLVLLGMGEAFYEGEQIPGAEALKRADIAPLELEAAEGLALINGTR